MIDDVDAWQVRAFEKYGPLSFSHTVNDVKRMLGAPKSDRRIEGFDPGRSLEYENAAGTKVRADFDPQGVLRNVSVAPLPAILLSSDGDEPVRVDTASPEWHAVDLGPRLLLRHGVSLFDKGGPRFSVSSRAYFAQLAPAGLVPSKPERKPLVEPLPEYEQGMSARAYAARGKKAAQIMTRVAPTVEELAPFARPAFAPQWTDAPDDAHASKLGGAPWLAQGESAPACRNCKAPMGLVLQVFARDMPLDAPALFDGVVQYFSCVDDDCIVDEVPGARTLRNAAVPKDLPKPAPIPKSKRSASTVKRITSWQTLTDYPQFGREDPTCDGEALARAFERLSEIFGTEAAAERTYSEVHPYTRTKLGGWPAWVQSPDHPKCPACKNGAALSLFLQLSDWDASVHGTTFLFQCRKHPGAFASRAQST